MLNRKRARGFTIVELLIVVVIIAILAAITLVTYSGIQQRANNTAIIDAASKSIRVIQAYIAANDAYPSTTSLCITTTSGCATTGAYTGNTAFENAMATIGTLPRTIPMTGADHVGIIYRYSASRTMNGSKQPVVLFYWLFGVSQQCSLPGITDSPGDVMLTSSAGYTSANDTSTGKTLCVVSIPGPSS